MRMVHKLWVKIFKRRNLKPPAMSNYCFRGWRLETV